MSGVAPHALKQITALVVRAVAPESVWLFGSQAKGTAGPHSDVDLLVVGDFAGPPHRRARELRALLDQFPLRIDLHLYTPAELTEARRDPHAWLSTLQAYAIALYRR